MTSDYETAIEWQMERSNLCPCCGIPKEIAWVWPGDDQAAKQARANEMTGARLCVFGRARQVFEDEQRKVVQEPGKPDVRGFITTFEEPTPEPASG